MSIERLNIGTLTLASDLPFHDSGADRRATVGELKTLVLDGFTGPSTAYTYLALPDDGITGSIALIQAAHDKLLNDFNGGRLEISPRLGPAKRLWEKTLFHNPKVKIDWPGKGLADFVVIDNFPLAQFVYRDTATGVVALRDLPARCLIYLIPYAPFDPTGQIITPSSEGVITTYTGFTIDGNKTNQGSNYIYGIYAPPGKTDPNWPFVAGAWSMNQVTNPGQGVVNMNADAQAYYGFTTEGGVEIFSTTGTQYFSGADRQRTHLLAGTKGTLGGLNNPDGTAITIARGFDLQGNDSWAFGGGWGNNNGACQCSGPSGMLRVQNNFFIPRGTDAESICTRDISPNGTALVGNVLNGLYQLQTSAGNAIKARGAAVVGNFFGWTDHQMQTSGANAGRPIGVTSDDGDAYVQIQSYEQAAVIGNDFSVGTDGTSPKYHIVATQGAGVLAWNMATSNTDGSRSYRGATPWFTDNTLGVVGGGWLDPLPGGTGAPVLHIGVSWKGLLSGPNVASTQFVQIDTPLIAKLVGRTDGTAPPVGFLGEPGANSGTIAAITLNAEADATTLQLQAGEHDLYGEVQFALGAVSVAAAAAFFEVSISTTANTMDRTSARIYAGDFLPIPAGGANGTPLKALRVGPLRVSLVGNQTYHLVVKGGAISTNTISAAGVLHSRRW